MTKSAISLDYDATTPIEPAVVEAMPPPPREHFGSPSSDHAYGERAHRAVDAARARLAALPGAAPDEIGVTGGGGARPADRHGARSVRRDRRGIMLESDVTTPEAAWR